MKYQHTSLPGVLLIERKYVEDERGFFTESWREDFYASAGIGPKFFQDNFALSKYGVLRGMHAQYPYTQGKLVSVMVGAVWDVVVDIRKTSPTFGKWFGITLSAGDSGQLWIPPGCAHGFVSLTENSLFHYKSTEPYSKASQVGFRWDDPEVGIDWPVNKPLLSDRDANAPEFSSLP